MHPRPVPYSGGPRRNFLMARALISVHRRNDHRPAYAESLTELWSSRRSIARSPVLNWATISVDGGWKSFLYDFVNVLLLCLEQQLRCNRSGACTRIYVSISTSLCHPKTFWWFQAMKSAFENCRCFMMATTLDTTICKWDHPHLLYT